MVFAVMIVESWVMTSTTLAAGWKVEGSPPAFGAVGRMPWGPAEALICPCVFDAVTALLFRHTDIESTSIIRSVLDCSRWFTMSCQRSCRLLSQRAVFQSARQSLLTRPRYMSTAPGTTDTSTLPLAGIKVLDMTRVLAGVRTTIPSKLGLIADT